MEVAFFSLAFRPDGTSEEEEEEEDPGEGRAFDQTHIKDNKAELHAFRPLRLLSSNAVLHHSSQRG